VIDTKKFEQGGIIEVKYDNLTIIEKVDYINEVLLKLIK